jgi:hypothetical protein
MSTAAACSCASCAREGRHDDWCTVHIADYEAMHTLPCDCGLRDGERRVPALTPVKVFARQR